jgi:hypothetical protein
MTCNVGGVERPIRIILGLALVAIAAFGTLPIGWMIAFYVIGGVMLVTGAIGFCPAWSLIGINTCPVNTTRKKAA